MEQVWYSRRQTIDAYEKDGLKFKPLDVFDVEYANLASITHHVSFFAAN